MSLGANARLVAVATHDPLARSTFSGFSAHLFEELHRQGVEIEAIATRDLRWHDALRGAVRWTRLGRPASRSSSRLDPDWLWSRRTHQTMTQRFRRRLERLGGTSPVLQIGTHVQAAGDGRRVYCVTDCTIQHAIESGGTYQVRQLSQPVLAEAIAWQREVFAGCERIFVLSEWAGRSVIEHYGQPHEKLVTIGAGANVPDALPARRPDLRSPAVLFVGLDWEQKGGPLLLDAFRRVRAVMPEARLVVVGCRPPALDREPGVEVLGRLDRSVRAEEERLLDTYAAAACFCIAPSVDAFPNVLLEAAAFGVPVVSTDEGSRGEAVVDRVTGRLVPPRDPDALAGALLELLRDPELAARQGSEGARRVRERFNWPTVARIVAEHMDLRSADGAP